MIQRMSFLTILFTLIFAGCATESEKQMSANDFQEMTSKKETKKERKKDKFITSQFKRGFERVFFNFDSAKIKDSEMKTAQKMAKHIKRAPMEVKIVIEGHTDKIGPEAYNLDLGAKRAESVARVLMRNGVNAERLSILSYGEKEPLIRTDDFQEMAQNRRVFFHIENESKIRNTDYLTYNQ